MTTFAMIEGIGEGPIISRRFRKHLESLGWQQTNAEQAEVILTHSGGLYLLPQSVHARLFIHIHPTQNMPMKRLFIAQFNKIRQELAFQRQKGWRQVGRSILHLGANSWYLLNLGRNLRMRKGFVNSDQYCSQLPAGKHVFIGGYSDELSDPAYFAKQSNDSRAYLSIKGSHDECWREPELYIRTIQQLVS